MRKKHLRRVALEGRVKAVKAVVMTQLLMTNSGGPESFCNISALFNFHHSIDHFLMHFPFLICKYNKIFLTPTKVYAT